MSTQHRVRAPKTAAPARPVARVPLGQPWTGLIGLAVVLAVAALLGLGLGAQDSLEAIGPMSTFCLPVLAVVALWWNGWPVAGRSAWQAGIISTAMMISIFVTKSMSSPSSLKNPSSRATSTGKS